MQEFLKKVKISCQTRRKQKYCYEKLYFFPQIIFLISHVQKREFYSTLLVE